MVAEVIANIEIDIEELIKGVMKEYEEPIEDVMMDDILEYVGSGMTYLDNPQARGVNAVRDGWPINGFSESTYYEIEKTLRKMQEENEQ